MATDIKGKTVVINQPSYAIYNAFSDLRRFTASLPEDKKQMVTSDEDSLMVKVQGMELGIRVRQRTPFSRIDFIQDGQTPFPFLITMNMDPADDKSTHFNIELHAELNTMMKMLFGNKLQSLVDKITEQIAQAAAGRMPEEWEKYVSL